MNKGLRDNYHWLIYTLLCSLCIFFVFYISNSQAAPTSEGIQVYQKNLHLSPEHKQKLADDIDRYNNADNFWDVLRDEFALEHYEESPLVQQKIEWFMNNQDFLLRSATRAAPYLYYISQQVKKRHLPAELVLLPIIESGYNPFSTSNMGATGIWQLMPGTASGLGIKHTGWYDGRRDVIASTRGALNYLAYLQNFFEGNWLLAIAAYNTGEGNVMTAIKKNIRDGKDTDFWSLPVAQQTKDYVPSLLALAIIISHPRQYPIAFPPVANAPYLAQIDIGTQINLKSAADYAGISYEKILQLNSGFYHRETTNKGPYKLVLPIENVEQFSENYSRTQESPSKINWLHYKVKSGDTLASIANKFETSVAAIRKLNRLAKNSVTYGANLLIPKKNKTVMAENSPEETEDIFTITRAEAKKEMQKHMQRTANLADNYALQPGDTVYMVRPKDTLASIAKRFKINSNDLVAANQLSNRKIMPGKQLIIPTHPASDANTLLPGDTLYMVRKGDTIDSIASRFNTTASTIRLANLLDDSALLEGQRIVVPTHMRG